MATNDYTGKVRAPEFPEDLDWFNIQRPLTLRDLRGKVVLLDFWSYCCINCMHVLPDLERLEREFPDELVVVGVHSGKFEADRESQNVQQAIRRYRIKHPVVNDAKMLIWRSYAVRAWPTVVLIDPAGNVVGGHTGEGVYGPLATAIREVVAAFEARGQLDRRPLERHATAPTTARSVLCFPGKVLADAASQRLFISDSNHNRIVIADLVEGDVIDVVGRGSGGRTDGSFERAEFANPQGLALVGDRLYVADTGNHGLRSIDFESRQVLTIAGDGSLARYGGREAGAAKRTVLNSPWDLVVLGSSLYIAMAGSHQIWRLDLGSGELIVHAGSGQEGLRDGHLHEAALAQPSGITTNGAHLFFADSEASAIRAAAADPMGIVSTVIGAGLFEFGDVDGDANIARLQHPIGIEVDLDRQFLYVADTYNNKIKLVEPSRRHLTTLFGQAEPGFEDGARREALFDEPAGLSLAGRELFIADTNNHAVRVADLDAGVVRTFALYGLDLLMGSMLASERTVQAGRGDDTERIGHTGGDTASPGVIEHPLVRCGPGACDLQIEVTVPEGFELHDDVPVRVRLTSSDAAVIEVGVGPSAADSFTVTAHPGAAVLSINLTAFYCDAENQGRCYFEESIHHIPLEVEEALRRGALVVRHRLRSPADEDTRGRAPIATET